ncbi:MAG: hypothetical protein C4324_01625 [Blastocatellia bacterium]|mgnify:CR=1 FL=1
MKKLSIGKLVTLLLAAIGILFVSGGDAAAQGRYVGQLSRSEVDNIIRQLEDSGDEFRRDFLRELDRSSLSGSQKRAYRNQVDLFENATNRLRSDFDRQNSWWESRNQVRNLINSAIPLNNTMNSIAFRQRIERQWNRLRNDINKLADTYDLPGIAGGGWNGGGWNPGFPGNPGNAIMPPSWAQGTFYGTAPNGSQIILTIGSDGSVIAFMNGNRSYGSFTRGNMLVIDGNTSKVFRTNVGINTVSTMNGETIVYSRNISGSENPGNPGGGNVPSWAIGTFRGRSPVDGTWITVTIGNNGNVAVNINGNVSYGSLDGTTLNINGATSTIYRRGNGIRTVSNTDGQTIDYQRFR